MRVLRRRMVARLDEEPSDVSCGNNAGDVPAVELEEPIDNPAKTIGTHAMDLSAIVGKILATQNEYP